MIWLLFLSLISVLLLLDLGVFHRSNHAITMKESLVWTLIWIVVSLLFGLVIYHVYEVNFLDINKHGVSPKEALIQYYTGYIIEKSLSLDNIFVIAMIFAYFKIEAKYQHNILIYGIIGAIVFRGSLILLGTSVIEKFHWSTYLFGAVLIYSAISMMTTRHDQVDYYKNPAIRLLSKIYPINYESKSGKFFVVENGKKYATMLFASLVVIEFTDIIFAVDSIPAIFAITTDSFIIYTSNIFAILGLRNLYFFLANMMDKFRYMKFSLIFILIFVGVKIALSNHYKLPASVSLIFILGALAIGILTSLLHGRDDTAKLEKPL